jgi:hypothetical protein
MSNPVAGWYPDTEVPGGERWWNGVQWSDQRRTSAPAAPPPPPAAPAAAPAPEAAPAPPAAPGYTAAPGDAAASIPAPVGAAASTPGYSAVPGSVPPPAYAAQPVVSTQQNALAITGLCLSIVSLFIGFFGTVPIAGVVVSVLGYRKSVELGGKGRGLAIAGIIVGGISLVLLLGGLVIQGLLR